MPAAGENFLKIDSSNMQKQRKVAFCRLKILKYGTFQIQESTFPTPPWEISGLTWQGATLISNFSKPPSTFETPKVQPPFSKEGGRAMARARVKFKFLYFQESINQLNLIVNYKEKSLMNQKYKLYIH